MGAIFARSRAAILSPIAQMGDVVRSRSGSCDVEGGHGVGVVVIE